MDRLKYLIIVFTALSLATVGWAEQDNVVHALRLELELVDGSRIIGVPTIKSVPVQTSYATMDIPLKQIVNIRIEDNHETASFELQNGDKLKGVVDLASIKIETVFGEVSIGIEHARAISVRRYAQDPRYGRNTAVQKEMYEALYDKQGQIPKYTKRKSFGNSKCYTALLNRATTTMIQPIDNPKRRYKYVQSGMHEYLTSEGVRNNWISVMIRGGGMTQNVCIDDFSLIFTDGNKSLNDAIAKGHIEPLVVIDSGVDQYAWRNPTVIADGTSPTESRSFPSMMITFKVTNGAEFTGVKFHSNRNFSKTHDGMQIYKYPRGYEISLSKQ
jgi:hypothetical protein